MAIENTPWGRNAAAAQRFRESLSLGTAPGTSDTTPAPAATVDDNFAIYKEIFRSYGLGDIWDEVVKGLKGKTGADNYLVVLEKVRASDTYKKKFSGIDERIAQGRSSINEAQYLNIKDSYTKTLELFGMKISDVFTDSKGNKVDEDLAFGKLIGGDVSPAEFQERVRIAEEWTKSVDPNIKESLKKFYGLEGKDLMAYALNPTGGQAVLQKKAAAVKLGAEAMKSGFDIASLPGSGPLRPTVITQVGKDQLGANYLQELATRGLSSDASPEEVARQTAIAREAVARAGAESTNISQLAAISGESVTAKEKVEAQLADITGSTTEADAKAARKIKRLSSQERARFSGRGTGTNIFSEDMSDF